MAIVLGRGTILYSREEWDARPPRSTASTTPDEGCVDHWLGPGAWTAGNIGDHSRCAPMLRSIQAYHMDVKRWSDIAYNFAVCPHGVGYTLRGFARSGANGTAYWNAHTYTVLWMVGEGDPIAGAVVDRMALGARDLMDWCVFAGRAAPTLRRGHRDVRQTACPGDRIHAISRANWWPLPPAPAPQEAPTVDIASTRSGAGYWLVDSKGKVEAFGDAVHAGDLAGAVLAKPVVGIAADPITDGYWLVAADGGVFSYGGARFYGSMGGTNLAAPVVDIAPTPTGGGYWLGAEDGGIFTFGDAAWYGSGVG